MKAPNLPQKEIIAFSFAALNPSENLWHKYIVEIDKLKDSQEITPKDHGILRYSLRAREELMNLTLGVEEALTKRAVSVILEKAKSEIKEELNLQLFSEQESHERTKKELESQIHKQAKMEKRIDKICKNTGFYVAIFLCVILSLIVLLGVVYRLTKIEGWPKILILILLPMFAIMTVVNLVFGITIKRIFRAIKEKITFFTKKILLKESFFSDD